ncbi:glutamine amidotransferase [Enterobacteriaceae bacterium LUAb1]
MCIKPVAPLAIIQLQTPPDAVLQCAGEQHQWFIKALQLQKGEYQVFRPDLGESLPAPDSICGAILSGSWAMVTDHAEWSERTAAWVRLAMEEALPLLGVCYGHQLMAYALGGEVEDNPKGWERGLQRLMATPALMKDQWLNDFPPQFSAWLSHRQSVLKPPKQAQVLAYSMKEACQILRYSDNALSVQFHPEFTQEIMDACLQNVQPSEGSLDPVHDQQELQWADTLLKRFWLQVREKQPVLLKENAV